MLKKIADLAGSQLRRNTIAGTLSAVAGVMIAAISYPVYLYFLGYEQYGLWLAVAVVLSFAQFGNLGLAPAIATRVAAHYARRDFDGLRATVSTALLTLTAVGLLALGAILLSGPWIIAAMRLSPALSKQALGLLPYVAALSVYVVQIEALNSVLLGLGRLDLSVATQILCRFFSLCVSALLLACGVGVVSLPIASLASYCCLHVASLHLANRTIRHRCFGVCAFEVSRLRELTTFGGGVLVCSLIGLLLGPLNKFVLTRYAGPASVPVYELAWSLGMQLRSVLESGLRALMPEVSRLSATYSTECCSRVQAVYARAMKLIFLAGLPAFAIVILFADPLIQFWLGVRFRPEIAPAVRILVTGCFFSLLGVPGYYTLIGLGRLRHIITGSVVQSLTNAGVLAGHALLGRGTSTTFVAAASACGLAAGGLYLMCVMRSAAGRSTTGLPSASQLTRTGNVSAARTEMSTLHRGHGSLR